jgi:hypothetical protein
MGSFEKNLAQGQLGEGIISKWLQERGHSVFPAYQIEQHTGKGPQLFSAARDLVLPDLLVFKGKNIHWVEAKNKTCFSWHRITSRWTTGIDLRHYEEYQEVSERTELPVWLVFWHPKSQPDLRDLDHGSPKECPTGLFGGDIDRLKDCENHRAESFNHASNTGHGKSGMVYWAVNNLQRLDSNGTTINANI